MILMYHRGWALRSKKRAQEWTDDVTVSCAAWHGPLHLTLLLPKTHRQAPMKLWSNQQCILTVAMKPEITARIFQILEIEI